ncbi:hypothetical protein BT96DRAFT_1003812 [Gymnopus androsaceus JB14]|uniref:G-protein coupled receptors family 1 profile domain-containing protein n=1 Tax=Gymnopus androsaceus JB14 TaxID=1447944 RepID=A0A6A4GT16_9AGAR|nr:hypothetical protein BT96DRAFT_1003812 [Gymnopus androsaceus JB14]
MSSSDISPPRFYGPVNETSSEILLEKTFLASGYLTGVGFGIQFVLYIACIQILWKDHRQHSLTKILIPYLTVLCGMNLIWTATSAYGLQLTYIDNRNYPGGVITFLGVEFALPANIVSTASYIAGNLLADALMIWRCYIVWAAAPSSHRVALCATVVPSLMLVGSLVLAILFALQTTGPAGLFASITAVFATPYFALSMVLNMVVTLLIVIRIWMYKRQGKTTEHERSGISVNTIFIESAALYSVVSMLVVVTFAIGHPISQIWLGISPSVISNYLIVYRLAQGRSWGNFQSRNSSETDGTRIVDEEKASLDL